MNRTATSLGYRAKAAADYTWEILDWEGQVVRIMDRLSYPNAISALRAFHELHGTSTPETCLTKADPVNHPDHYTVGGYEALDVIKAKLTEEEYRGYCKGNALKYLMRANYKGHHDNDCQKAEFYLKEISNEIKVRAEDCQVPEGAEDPF